MRLLPDTHFIFWLIAEPHRTRPKEAGLIRTSEVAVSAVSIWEFRLKRSRRSIAGVRKGPIGPNILLAALRARDLQLLPLTPELAAALLDPPIDHTDPFDELLLAHAQQRERRLLTRDKKLVGHPAAVAA